jgi:hypothetical protein
LQASDGHEWALPCRCGKPFCDGIRYVGASEGDVDVLFVGAHLLDPGNLTTRIVNQWLGNRRGRQSAQRLRSRSRRARSAPSAKANGAAGAHQLDRFRLDSIEKVAERLQQEWTDLIDRDRHQPIPPIAMSRSG